MSTSHTRLRSLYLPLVAALSLAACGGGTSSSEKFDGDRISVLSYETALRADPRLGDKPVSIIPAFRNSDWTNPGGFASHAAYHLELDGLGEGFRIKAVEGNSGLARIKAVPIVADGGIVTGGDICKCIACGADAVMIGSPIARAEEAPGRGFHWGMATPSPVLPRGTRINVGNTGSIERILRGPAKLDDGTHNLLGCLKTSMGTLGAQTIKEMQQVEVVVAPSLLTEGKVYQKAQHLGMGK